MIDHFVYAPALHFWVVWSALAVVVAVALVTAFRQWSHARTIEDVPTSKIRSAHQGYVELEGQGRHFGDEPLVSPLTGKACLWYRFKVEKKEVSYGHDNARTRWRTVRNGCSDEPFCLEDETGLCVVDPDGAAVTVSDTLTWYGDSELPVDVPLLGTGRIGCDGRYRYSESLILEGQPLYAMGEFRTQNAVSGYSVAERTRDIIREWKRNPQHLLAGFDANKDGELDQREWARVRNEARRQAEQTFAEEARQPDLHVLGKPRHKRHPYFLSTYPQDKLTRRYRWIAAVAMTVFFVLGAAAVWLLAMRLAALR